MTSRERNAIWSYHEYDPGLYTIRNSRKLGDNSCCPDYPGLQVYVDKYCAGERLTMFVREADIDILQNRFYLDEGLFRIHLISAFLGKETAGWKITEIEVNERHLAFYLQNPALHVLGSGDTIKTLREFKKLGAEHDYSDDADKFFAGPLLPAPNVLVMWDLPMGSDARPEHTLDFYFAGRAPKPSGKYPKHKRTAISISDDDVRITEMSKKHHREFLLLQRSPEQEERHEQPVRITDTYYA